MVEMTVAANGDGRGLGPVLALLPERRRRTHLVTVGRTCASRDHAEEAMMMVSPRTTLRFEFRLWRFPLLLAETATNGDRNRQQTEIFE